MQPARRWIPAIVLALLTAGHAVGKKNEFRFSAGPGTTLTLTNEFGSIAVLPSSANQVVVSASPHSEKVEIRPSQHGNRIDVHTRGLQRGSDSEMAVDYQVQVPPATTVIIRCAAGSLRTERLQGDVTLQGESAKIEVRDLNGAHLHVRTVSGPVMLTNISNSYVDVTSVGGAVTMNNVNGPKVSVNTSNGAIKYVGDFGANGNYNLTSHAAGIDVVMPASASVDLTARSLNGAVRNEFPFQPKPGASVSASPRGFAGLANSGASSVLLSSFSGTITVTKQ